MSTEAKALVREGVEHAASGKRPPVPAIARLAHHPDPQPGSGRHLPRLSTGQPVLDENLGAGRLLMEKLGGVIPIPEINLRVLTVGAPCRTSIYCLGEPLGSEMHFAHARALMPK